MKGKFMSTWVPLWVHAKSQHACGKRDVDKDNSENASGDYGCSKHVGNRFLHHKRWTCL